MPVCKLALEGPQGTAFAKWFENSTPSLASISRLGVCTMWPRHDRHSARHWSAVIKSMFFITQEI